MDTTMIRMLTIVLAMKRVKRTEKRKSSRLISKTTWRQLEKLRQTRPRKRMRHQQVMRLMS